MLVAMTAAERTMLVGTAWASLLDSDDVGISSSHRMNTSAASMVVARDVHGLLDARRILVASICSPVVRQRHTLRSIERVSMRRPNL